MRRALLVRFVERRGDIVEYALYRIRSEVQVDIGGKSGGWINANAQMGVAGFTKALAAYEIVVHGIGV